jgi:predicted glutamine amidotransferase
MCIILHKPKMAELDVRLLSMAHRGNRHGFGLMFPIADGTVSVHKGVMDIESILELWDTFKSENVAIHFRWSTGGAINNENCHPFRVLSKQIDGRDLWMMHNGVFAQVNETAQYCDTYHFVKEYMTPVLKKDSTLIDNPKFIKFLGESIGFFNKLLFMDGNGKVIIVNKNSGEEKNNIWSSSSHFLDSYSDQEYEDEEEDSGEFELVSVLSQEERESCIRLLARAIDERDDDTIDELVEKLDPEGEEICETLEALTPQERKDVYNSPWNGENIGI